MWDLGSISKCCKAQIMARGAISKPSVPAWCLGRNQDHITARKAVFLCCITWRFKTFSLFDQDEIQHLQNIQRELEVGSKKATGLNRAEDQSKRK